MHRKYKNKRGRGGTRGGKGGGKGQMKRKFTVGTGLELLGG